MVQTVIFDFDGTIINTNTLIEDGLNYFAYRYRGYRLTREEIQMLTGRPLETQMAYISEEKATVMTEQFRIWYAHNHNEKVSPFPGMLRLIKRLKTEGYTLAIVTNNGRQALHMGLSHLGLEGVFDAVITREDVMETKPSAEGLLKVLGTTETLSEDAVYIGDTASDMTAARTAGVTAILVGWSILSPQAKVSANPDFLAVSTTHLENLIKGIDAEVA